MSGINGVNGGIKSDLLMNPLMVQVDNGDNLIAVVYKVLVLYIEIFEDHLRKLEGL